MGRERHLLGMLDQRSDLEPEQRGGNQPEVAERAVAAPDVGGVDEGPPEAFLPGTLLQRRLGVGDGDEVRAVFHLAAEVPVEGIDFGGAAALRADQEERPAQIEPPCGRAHRVGSGGIEHAQIEAAFALAEHARDHVGRERGPAHAQQQAVLELLRGLLGERGDLR